MIIAVDFDGTIVEHMYPEIGKEIPFAVSTLKAIAKEGHTLILWSCREDKLLDDAVQWCSSRGLEFYAVNRDSPDASYRPTGGGRKLRADLFIDDRNVGGLPDWGVIYDVIHNGLTFEEYYRRQSDALPKKKGFWARLKDNK